MLPDHVSDPEGLQTPALSPRYYRAMCSRVSGLCPEPVQPGGDDGRARGIIVDHSTLHRWVIRLLPLLDKAFRQYKRYVARQWRMDETYIKIKGRWKYLYQAVDSNGQTIDFLLAAKRDAGEALRFFRKAIRHQGVGTNVIRPERGH